MTWKRYSDLEPIRRLRNEGRELYGQRVLLTEKRDGENVSLWLDVDERHELRKNAPETLS